MPDNIGSTPGVNPDPQRTNPPAPGNSGGGPPAPPALPPPLPRRVPLAPAPAPPPRRGMPGWAIALILCACMVPVTALLAGLLLPALFIAKQKAQMAVCENNLKQIGLAMKVWASEHNDKLPMNVSTNQGGVLELCSPGPDGFDRNSWRLFQVLSNELGNPKILVDPGDTTKEVGTDFSHLQAVNVSYLIVSGASESNPGGVLVYCPTHHTVLMVDGSVQRLTDDQAQQLLYRLAQKR